MVVVWSRSLGRAVLQCSSSNATQAVSPNASSGRPGVLLDDHQRDLAGRYHAVVDIRAGYFPLTTTGKTFDAPPPGGPALSCRRSGRIPNSTRWPAPAQAA